MSLTDMSFGSEAASLEYDFLCNMLELPQNFWSNPDIPSTAVTGTPAAATAAATTAPITTSTTTASKPVPTAVSNPTSVATANGPVHTSHSSSTGSTQGFVAGGLATAVPLQPLAPMPPSHLTPAPASTLIKRDSVSSAGSQKSSRKRPPQRTPEMVYNSVRHPFNYAIGFHDLIRYVREK